MYFNQGSLNKLGLAGNESLAGQKGASSFGLVDPNLFQEYKNYVSSEDFKGLSKEDQAALRTQLLSGIGGENQIVRDILSQQAKYLSPEYQQQMLEMADKYQTRKGLRQTAFNLFGSGMDNLTRGIASNFNPYGTEEGRQMYLSGLQNYINLTANAPQAMAAGFQSVRTPLNISPVQVGAGPTYF